MAEIIFDETFPELLKDAARDSINSVLWLIPAWLQNLYVAYRYDETEAAAYICVDKEYRFARITICGSWQTAKNHQRDEYILHEILHLYNAPVKNFAIAQIERMTEEGDLRDLMRDELIARNEAATSDLTYAIKNKFKGEN